MKPETLVGSEKSDIECICCTGHIYLFFISSPLIELSETKGSQDLLILYNMVS
jgi:hypothetical protein